ncbi:hypothetical protein PR048_012015 [Dryococelus australis]|uniref:Uncharacterized protein n=1 Tax=Dryococelus australis TaxID=614101 RepID=A0ABQ9HN55_9NEOP|nr:hypothetical protein PR048_012015 [Dryococelus australis]
MLEMLNATTCKAWELHFSSQNFLSLDELLKFLELRCKAIEIMQTTQAIKPEISEAKNMQYKFCREQHALHNCEEFMKASIQQHVEFVRKEKHHTLLHTDTHSDQAPHFKSNREHQLQKHNQNHISQCSLRGSNTEQESSTFNYCSLKIKLQTQILLASALVKMRGKYGRLQICRTLGSKSLFITEECMQHLGLKKRMECNPDTGNK